MKRVDFISNVPRIHRVKETNLVIGTRWKLRDDTLMHMGLVTDANGVNDWNPEDWPQLIILMNEMRASSHKDQIYWRVMSDANHPTHSASGHKMLLAQDILDHYEQV